MTKEGGPDYTYDFAYSVNFEKGSLQPGNDNKFMKQQFRKCTALFGKNNLIPDRELSPALLFLLKTPPFERLCFQCLDLVNFNHDLSGETENKQEKIEKCRQNIFQGLQQIQQILDKQKNKYMSSLVLCIYVILLKTLKKYRIQQFVLFHLVHWQLRGLLTNKSTMQASIKKLFNMQSLRDFMMIDLDQQQKLTKSNKIRSDFVKQSRNFDEPLTFRSSFAGMKRNNQSVQMSHSTFREVSMSMLNKTNKQNTDFNQNQTNTYRKEEEHPNFNTFKKKQQKNSPLISPNSIRSRFQPQQQNRAY